MMSKEVGPRERIEGWKDGLRDELCGHDGVREENKLSMMLEEMKPVSGELNECQSLGQLAACSIPDHLVRVIVVVCA